jgi:cellulose synthase/poly-beta-1,6-N-acetylglucosamine synthase-like glycosyltransferase
LVLSLVYLHPIDVCLHDKGAFLWLLFTKKKRYLACIMSYRTHPKVSVIIAFYKNLAYLEECVKHCLELDYPNYEVLVVSNLPLELSDERVKVIITDKVGQGHKKNLGVAHATGEICAFVDDDAYPNKDWIKNAVKYFDDPDIVAVGGPGITPPNDSLMQKAGGLVYSLPIGSGKLSYRYISKERNNVSELPGYNLFIRKSFLQEIGGFDVKYRSGEDTLLSHKLVETGRKFKYAPDVVVYHHRRPLFIPHLKQVATYALHRGYFMKKYQRMSEKLFYAAPSIFLVAVTVWAILSLFIPTFRLFLIITVIAYIILAFILAIVSSKSFKLSSLTSIGIPLTHITYAVYFIRGLLIRDLKERPSY